jgi:membrane protein
MTPKQLLTLAKESVESFGKHKAPQLAAALSYYTVFSLAPLLVVAIAIAGLVFGQAAARNEIVNQISGTVGADAANLIQTMIQNVNKPGVGILATIVGVFTVLLTAAGAFGQIKGALNTIWDVEPPKGPGGLQGILFGIHSQLLSFGMVLIAGVLLLASLALSTVLASISQFTSDRLPIPVGVWDLVNIVVSFGVLLLMFAAIYKVLPDLKIAWRDVLLGAGVTSFLFVTSKWLIGQYLGHTANASAYGAAGALVLILLWIYYSAHIFFLGAEFTQIYARRHGSLGAGQDEAAVAIADVKRVVIPANNERPVPAVAVNLAENSHVERHVTKTKAVRMQHHALRSRAIADDIDRVFNIVSPLALVGIRVFILVNQLRGVGKREKKRLSKHS